MEQYFAFSIPIQAIKSTDRLPSRKYLSLVHDRDTSFPTICTDD